MHVVSEQRDWMSTRAGYPPAKFWSITTVVIVAFLLEAIVAKSNVQVINLSFTGHMFATVGFLGAILVLWLSRPIADFRRTTTPGLERVRLVVALLATWSLLSCFAQSDGFTTANLAFWCVWTTNLFVMWWLVPILVRSLGARERVRLLATVLLLVAVSCCLLHPVNGYQQGRLVGMFVNATYSGRMLSIGTIASFTIWLTDNRKQYSTLLLLAMCVVLLALTRTRASIAAACVGCTTVFLTVQMAGGKWRNDSARHRASIVFVAVALISLAASQVLDLNSAAAFLRLDGGIERVMASREMNWGNGYEEFTSYGIFGKGFMSRFGDASNPRYIGGIAVPRYDWLTADDPLSMWISMAKQSGVPAMFFLAMLVYAIWKLADEVNSSQPRCLIRGIMVAGLVFGTLDGNWLLSFGDPIDRFCLLSFAVLGSSRTPTARHMKGREPTLRQQTCRTRTRGALAAR